MMRHKGNGILQEAWLIPIYDICPFVVEYTLAWFADQWWNPTSWARVSQNLPRHEICGPGKWWTIVGIAQKIENSRARVHVLRTGRTTSPSDVEQVNHLPRVAAENDNMGERRLTYPRILLQTALSPPPIDLVLKAKIYLFVTFRNGHFIIEVWIVSMIKYLI